MYLPPVFCDVVNVFIENRHGDGVFSSVANDCSWRQGAHADNIDFVQSVIAPNKVTIYNLKTSWIHVSRFSKTRLCVSNII